MIDKIQATGALPNVAWFGGTGLTSKNFPFANHRGSTGASNGGNFLYEDASVIWRRFDPGNYKNTIDVGSASSGWVVFYRPADLGTGPW
jgi:hypothetical protein